MFLFIKIYLIKLFLTAKCVGRHYGSDMKKGSSWHKKLCSFIRKKIGSECKQKGFDFK